MSTSTKFTEGPWHMDSEGGVCGGFRGDETVVDNVSGSSPNEAVANARLIAAAPELLEALHRIVEWVDAGCDPSQKSIEAARAALAKAEGRS